MKYFELPVNALLFPIYVITSCVGLYLLKLASSWSSLIFLSGVTLYVLGAGIWLAILRVYPLSVAFPVASGALMIGTTLIGIFILKEHVSTQHIIGIFFIMTGIGMVALSTGQR